MHASKPAPTTTMATHASFATIDEAITHNLTLALLGLEHAPWLEAMWLPAASACARCRVRSHPTLSWACARGDAVCPGHRLPLHTAKHALACCVECGTLVAHSAGSVAEVRRAAGAVSGTSVKKHVTAHPHLLLRFSSPSPRQMWRAVAAAGRARRVSTPTTRSTRRVAGAAVPNSTPSPPPPPPATPPPSAYVHLPFCVRKCAYCDFPVHALGVGRAPTPGGPPPPPEVGRYVSTLLTEVRATRRVPGAAALHTVSFGGGTPSLVPPDDIARILDALDGGVGPIAAEAEVTLEADPATFDAPKVAAYMAAGVTRFSIGVQSFDDGLLAACGRSHTGGDARRAVEIVAAASPRSWSMDLISGLPGLTLDGWQTTLHDALAYKPPAASVYDLTLEPGTPFARAAALGALPLPPDVDAAAMLAAAAATLPADGLDRVEVSSWARPGHACAHNGTYWKGDTDYYAFGLGATSRLHGARVARPRTLAAWRAWVEALVAAGDGVPRGVGAASPPAPPSADDVLLDVVMLRLRTAAGLDVDWVATHHSAEAADAVARSLDAAASQGRAVVTATRGNRPVYALTDAGFLVSNSVISDVFAALDRIGVVGEESD